ncbi:hypothetical protein LMG22037_05937 [Paraburkholderia phenoliruptrix]|uniref:Uncharacterized protein n=1 Tax=Paraburkholderia phenoliruptrix TaxID=252970 RepID=A0A6J5CH70_9BURK|nr:hypothetical protein LMG22037_05937 [Paraburkholderia phenoliruptrix]
MNFRKEVQRIARSPRDLEDLVCDEEADVIEIRFACSEALFSAFLPLGLKFGVGFILPSEFKDQTVPDRGSPLYRRAIANLDADRNKPWADCLTLARSQSSSD